MFIYKMGNGYTHIKEDRAVSFPTITTDIKVAKRSTNISFIRPLSTGSSFKLRLVICVAHC